MKMGTECSETSAYKIQTGQKLPTRKHTTYRTRRKFEINNTHFFINHVPKFKYQGSHVMANT